MPRNRSLRYAKRPSFEIEGLLLKSLLAQCRKRSNIAAKQKGKVETKADSVDFWIELFTGETLPAEWGQCAATRYASALFYAANEQCDDRIAWGKLWGLRRSAPDFSDALQGHMHMHSRSGETAKIRTILRAGFEDDVSAVETKSFSSFAEIEQMNKVLATNEGRARFYQFLIGIQERDIPKVLEALTKELPDVEAQLSKRENILALGPLTKRKREKLEIEVAYFRQRICDTDLVRLIERLDSKKTKTTPRKASETTSKDDGEEKIITDISALAKAICDGIERIHNVPLITSALIDDTKKALSKDDEMIRAATDAMRQVTLKAFADAKVALPRETIGTCASRPFLEVNDFRWIRSWSTVFPSPYLPAGDGEAFEAFLADGVCQPGDSL